MIAKNHGKSIAVIGCGNIGSFLVGHLARVAEIARIILVDHERYETKNLASQDIHRGNIGQKKIRVQTRRLKQIRPDIEIHAFCDRVENIPMGLLRADLIASCLDSRSSRLAVSQVAWRLGIPMVDAGVEPGGLLARVNVYVPGPDSPCYECTFSNADYDALEQVYACDGDTGADSTNASSSLGGLAASLECIECQKLLQADKTATVGKQLLIDAASHRFYFTALKHNGKCRFDHRTWKVRRLQEKPREITLESLLVAASHRKAKGPLWLSVERRSFVRKLVCDKCGRARNIFRLQHRLRQADKKCSRCGCQMVAVGFDMQEQVDLASLPTRFLKRTLASLGVRPHDVFTVRTISEEKHYEIGS